MKKIILELYFPHNSDATGVPDDKVWEQLLVQLRKKYRLSHWSFTNDRGIKQGGSYE